MSDAPKGLVILTEPMETAYLNLLKPRAYQPKGSSQPKGDPKYSLTLIFSPDHPDFPSIKNAYIAVAKERWPNRDLSADIKAGTLSVPWKDGNKEIAKLTAKLARTGQAYNGKLDWAKDKLFMRASSQNQPTLAITLPGGRVSGGLDTRALDMNKSKFYSGVKVLAELNLAPYEGQRDNDPDGVTAYCNIVVSTGEGERRGGQRDPAQVFSGYVGRSVSDDPTLGDPDGLDDEIPF